MKWAADLSKNRARRKSRAELDAKDAGAPFERSLFDPPEGPRTVETRGEVAALLNGLELCHSATAAGAAHDGDHLVIHSTSARTEGSRQRPRNESPGSRSE